MCTGSFGPNRPRRLPAGAPAAYISWRSGAQVSDQARVVPVKTTRRGLSCTRMARPAVFSLPTRPGGMRQKRAYPAEQQAARLTGPGVTWKNASRHATTRGTILTRHMVSVAAGSSSDVGVVKWGLSATSSEWRGYGRYDAAEGAGLLMGGGAVPWPSMLPRAPRATRSASWSSVALS